MRKFLNKAIVLQFGVALVLWFAVIIVANHYATKLSKDRRVEHTYQVLLNLKEINSNIENIESDKRAFVLTGDTRFLDVYQSALADINHLRKQLSYLTADNPFQQQRLNALSPLIAAKISLINQAITLRQKNGFEAARDFFMNSDEEPILNQIRNIERDLENEEYRLLQEGYSKEIQFNNITIFFLNIGRFLAFVIMCMAFLRVFYETKIRLNAEKNTRESEERLNFALESAQMGIWDLDLIKDAAVRSLRHDQIFGYKELQPQWGKEFFLKHVWPEDIPGVQKAFEDAYKEGFLKLDCRIMWPDGSIHWIYAQGRVQRDENGKPVRLLGVVVDNTDRKRSEEELIEVQRQIIEAQIFLNSIIENIPNMIFVKDAQSLKFVRFNKAGEDLIGISRKEMIGKSDYDFFPPDQAGFFVKKDKEALAQGETVDIPEEIIETKKGLRILHTKKVTIHDQKGRPKYLLGISEDVTEIKLSEKRLKETLLELERSNKDLEQFAYVASHDLQEPLRMVASFCQLLEKRYKDQLDDKAKEYIAYAVDSSKRMQIMVDDLLSYARVGKKSEKVPVNLNKVLQTILIDLAIPLKKTHAVLNISLLPTVIANPTQMLQLFLNLINNALKFKGEKDPAISVSAAKKGDYWEFVVSDNGIGIAKEYFERIFVIFKQLHSKRVYSGTGIGLALCKKIIEHHGGQIWVESEVGKGTAFYFTLPALK